MENRFCVIGEKLAHTRSPQIHNAFFEIKGEKGVYDVREVARENICSCRDLLLSYDGVNVTIPYKTDVMQNLDYVSEEAQGIGAVNTIRNVGGVLEGYNSDPYGFAAMLAFHGINPSNKRATVLGYGGAAKSVVFALRAAGAKVTVVSRNPDKVREEGVKAIDYERLYSDCGKGVKGDLLVNCTSVGMYPAVGVSPVDERIIENYKALADIVYNPMYTEFLRTGARLKKRCAGGLYMLVAQAMKSQSIWRNQPVDVAATKQIFKQLSFEEAVKGGLNVYLTGIMSCGKSTLGRELAKATGREFVDMDDYITQREGRSIKELFKDGEDTFRDAESRALYELSLRKGLIVATGGGCIKNIRNRDVMLLSGATVFVRRNVKSIIATADCSSRPLLADGAEKLDGIFRARRSRYYDCAQQILANEGTQEEGLEKLVRILDSRR